MDFDATVKSTKRKKIKNVIVAVVVIAIIFLIGFYVCSENLFFVKSVAIKDRTGGEGLFDEFPYTEQEMLKGLGIKVGTGLYDFDARDAEKNAKYNLSYIKEIKISRLWPSTVVAKTVLEKPEYYASVDDELYIIADNLKVLEKTQSPEKIELGSLIYLECTGIHSCIVGEKLGIDEDIEEIILNLEKSLSENRVKNEITSINVSDKFNLSLSYGTKYIVKLGDSKSLGTKIEFMKRIIEDRTDDLVGGTIDVSDEKNREAIYKKFK
ncbi:MAG: FtsQ-type POTRA domain-containing protein [Clostridia bacterium]|nr:FtsQ-type POTRA domain-containing protein [Clostridia bacterium]